MASDRARPLAFALLLGAAAMIAGHAAANFGGSEGFSGKNGLTCVACHTPPPALADEAAVTLDGLPADGWLPGATYPLTVRVAGGPPALPDPQPQGGFDLATSAGRLTVPPGMADAVRLAGPREATYTAAGTLMREWRVDWTAPTLATEPAPVRMWLAVLAANGNHVVAANASTGGERMDAGAALARAVPPAAAALDAWRALPLAPPSADATRSAAWVVEGRHADGNATAVAARLDGGPWQARETGPTWRIEVPVMPGNHTLELRSEGAGRTSPTLTLALAGPPPDADAQAGALPAPVPAALPILLAALALAALARSRP